MPIVSYKSGIIYVAIAGVFFISLGLTYWLSDNQAAQSLATAPMVASLVVGLFQLLRDQWSHDRAVALMEVQNRFVLGATSHMAIVAFDKLVCFSEKYVAEVQEILTTLFREGPTDKVLSHAGRLFTIRQNFGLWLTSTMETHLGAFESALRRLGADAHFIEAARKDAGRPEVVARMYRRFANLVGAEVMGAAEWEGERLDEEQAVSMVVRRLRLTLGSEALMEMRSALMQKAVTSI